MTVPLSAAPHCGDPLDGRRQRQNYWQQTPWPLLLCIKDLHKLRLKLELDREPNRRLICKHDDVHEQEFDQPASADSVTQVRM